MDFSSHQTMRIRTALLEPARNELFNARSARQLDIAREKMLHSLRALSNLTGEEPLFLPKQPVTVSLAALGHPGDEYRHVAYGWHKGVPRVSVCHSINAAPKP